MKATEITRLTNMPNIRRNGARWLRSSLEVVCLLVLGVLLVQEVAAFSVEAWADAGCEPSVEMSVLPAGVSSKTCEVPEGLVKLAGLSEKSIPNNASPDVVEPESHAPVTGSVLHGAIVPIQ